MKKLIVIGSIFLLPLMLLAQAPGILWQRCYGSTDGDGPKAVRETSDGGLILACISYGNNFDVSGHHGSSSSNDAWIVKLNSSGAIMWQRSLGGNSWDQVTDILQSADGSYMVLGWSMSNGCGVAGTKGGNDLWLLKLDDQGNILWQKSYGGSSEESSKSLCPTPDGGFILSGVTLSGDGDVVNYHGNGSGDYWFIKVNSVGDIQWSRAVGGTGSDWLHQAISTPDGGCIGVGYANSNNGDVTGNHGMFDAWVVKISPTGTIDWQKSYGSTGGDEARSIVLTDDGGYVFAGYGSANDGDVSGLHIAPGGHTEDFWVVKITSTGNIVWQKTYGGFLTEMATNMIITADGNFVITGDANSSNGDLTCNNGGIDTWVIKINNTGSLLWQKNIGGQSIDGPNQIIQLTDGNLLAAITTCSPNIAGFHPSTSMTCGDLWVVKLSSGGTSLPSPSLSISPTSACIGVSNSFTATAANMGSIVNYQWTRNGTQVSNDNPVYTANDFRVGDVIQCVATNTGTCDNNSSQAIAGFTITAKPALNPTIAISASTHAACGCTPVKFTATATNGGSSPVFEWTINGVKAGVTTSTFIISTLVAGDIVNCVYRDNSGCVPNGGVISNSITMTNGQSQTATATITASGNNVCPNTLINFIATPVNAGNNPTFQWKVNGLNTGTNSSLYSSSTLVQGDQVTCTITPDPGYCVAPSPYTTSPIVIIIRSKTNPGIVITAASNSNEFCSGAEAIFHANVTNAGDHPLFQWQVNGINAGTNSSDFSTTSLQDGNIISCMVTVDPAFSNCSFSPVANSNNISVRIKIAPLPGIVVTEDKNDVCQGDPVRLTASAVDAGNNPGYQWMVNNVLAGTGPLFNNSNLSDGSIIYCVLKPDAGSCSSNSFNSNTIIAKVNPNPMITIHPADTLILPGTTAQLTTTVSGNIQSYEWTPANLLENASVSKVNTVVLQSTTQYNVIVKTDKGCKGSATARVKVGRNLWMPNAFTPNNDGLNDLFIIPSTVYLQLTEFSVFDRWGNRIFTTADMSKGWNGTSNGRSLDSGIFIYVIKGKDEKGVVMIKGTVALVK